MRIWSEKLIPILCQKHLCGMWRESLGAYKIIIDYKKTGKKLGYLNHPATQEFINSPEILWDRLKLVRDEMLSRGYNPKEMPKKYYPVYYHDIAEWQSLEQQIEILKNKGCKCQLDQL